MQQPLANDPTHLTGPPPLRPIVIGESERTVPLFRESPLMLTVSMNHRPVNGHRAPPFTPARVGAGVVKRNAHGRLHKDGNQGFQQHQKNQLKRLKDRIGGPVRPVPEYEQRLDLDSFHETPNHGVQNSEEATSSYNSPKGTKRRPIDLDDETEAGTPVESKKSVSLFNCSK